LALLTKLTSRKRKLYEHVRNKEGALCKLKEKYVGKKVKKLCDVGDLVVENLSSGGCPLQ
jgi:hypothetical protein